MSRVSSHQPPIHIIGVNGRADRLPPHLQTLLAQADLLVGGRRHLADAPTPHAERLPIGNNIAQVVDAVRAAWTQGRRVVVLASGDPLCYGIGATLRRFFPAEALRIHPAPSAFQLAFAALGEPWHDAALLSAHARPLADVVAQALVAPKAAILTDPVQTPAVVARALLDAGMPPDAPAAVCENLALPDERIWRGTLAAAAQTDFAPLNVFVVWQPAPPRSPEPPGIPDHLFATDARQITKREIRLLVLAELRVRPGEVVWDIGAGSGAVSIELACAVPSARCFAVERRAHMFAHLCTNLNRFPAPNVHAVLGEAPDACADWPAPHAVFIGGSGGRLAEILAAVRARLRPGGRLVCTLATLDNLYHVRRVLPTARWYQVQINHGVPIGASERLRAENPIWIVCYQHEEQP
ncbi:bifunctional cobalt-precorrin-7 (C(5))-methyltransferase/cobalt-precorrin-6B (C(15))-methyltransferase [Ardenticatena maritima]|uniref:Precorrin-6Y C5,15-methyltransferase n=3 Tax=Ardenticatena maritima TaxID=872965 RepID=A0A0P6YUU6_9CHLR|nr:bifunctional cobalt-precorrin-7 (C(5))-methyltransferase/cobalt-precorrin-6B (C(15))-methyltransferase [Ardenticatena maritima]KPL87582.1 precorrin-6Y C5,15-methyltransferase [Ardenticatena maritima]